MTRIDLIKKIIDEQFCNNQAAFARAIGKSPAQVNQWISGVRAIGDGVARQIEIALELPPGRMWTDGEIEHCDAAQMGYIHFNIHMDKNLRDRAFSVIESYGLTPAQAVKLFFNQIAGAGSIPLSFDYKPNHR